MAFFDSFPNPVATLTRNDGVAVKMLNSGLWVPDGKITIASFEFANQLNDDNDTSAYGRNHPANGRFDGFCQGVATYASIKHDCKLWLAELAPVHEVTGEVVS